MGCSFKENVTTRKQPGRLKVHMTSMFKLERNNEKLIAVGRKR